MVPNQADVYKRQRQHRRDKKIQQVQHPGGVPGAGGQLTHHGTGHFRLEDVHGPVSYTHLHPLYLRADAQAEPFDVEEYVRAQQARAAAAVSGRPRRV